MNHNCKAISTVNLFFAAPAMFILLFFMAQQLQIDFPSFFSPPLFFPLACALNSVSCGLFKSVSCPGDLNILFQGLPDTTAKVTPKEELPNGMLQEKEDASVGLSSRDLKCPLFETSGDIPSNALLEPVD